MAGFGAQRAASCSRCSAASSGRGAMLQHGPGARALAARPARARGLPGRGAGHRRGPIWRAATARCARARPVRALGAAYRPRAGKRLFGRDAEGHRLRARSRRRPDRHRAARGKLLDAFERLIRDKGGAIRTGADVARRQPRRAAAAPAACVLADGRDDRGPPRRDLLDGARPALRPPAGAAPPCRPTSREGAGALPLRQGQHADPLRAVGARRAGGRRASSARWRCCT